MNKILSILVILMLLVSPVVFAAPASSNVMILGNGGATGIVPVTEVIRVRYGMRGGVQPSLASGDAVIWDTTSADGITISGCITNNDAAFAGVLVTDVLTADNSFVRLSDRNWGWMAIKGYALAKCDTSLATTGKALCTNGVGLSQSLGTVELVTTVAPLSADIGVLLTDTGSDGLMRVWLR